MSIDKTLNLTAKVKPIITNQEDARRKRLMRRIENQIVIANSVNQGEIPAKPYERLPVSFFLNSSERSRIWSLK